MAVGKAAAPVDVKVSRILADAHRGEVRHPAPQTLRRIRHGARQQRVRREGTRMASGCAEHEDADSARSTRSRGPLTAPIARRPDTAGETIRLPSLEQQHTDRTAARRQVEGSDPSRRRFKSDPSPAQRRARRPYQRTLQLWNEREPRHPRSGAGRRHRFPTTRRPNQRSVAPALDGRTRGKAVGRVRLQIGIMGKRPGPVPPRGPVNRRGPIRQVIE